MYILYSHPNQTHLFIFSSHSLSKTCLANYLMFYYKPCGPLRKLIPPIQEFLWLWHINHNDSPHLLWSKAKISHSTINCTFIMDFFEQENSCWFNYFFFISDVKRKFNLDYFNGFYDECTFCNTHIQTTDTPIWVEMSVPFKSVLC